MKARRGLFRRKGSRWTWHSGKVSYLFVDGREYLTGLPARSKSFLEALCAQRHLSPDWLSQLTSVELQLIHELVRDGHLLTSP
jgi:prepilin-type processing-associated H-X9-DG protein